MYVQFVGTWLGAASLMWISHNKGLSVSFSSRGGQRLVVAIRHGMAGNSGTHYSRVFAISLVELAFLQGFTHGISSVTSLIILSVACPVGI